jgi:uncharacterized Fe-S cluster protein YjdI
VGYGNAIGARLNGDVEADAGHGGADAPPDTHESNRAPDLTREYRNDEIAVRWYAKRCIHSAACIRKAPRVFDPRRRPWIDLDAGETQRIIAAVEACPTGALEYMSAGGPPQTSSETKVQVVADGPLFLRGNIKIVGENGNVIRESTRVALCRCGKSANKPFCDNSHRAR